MSRTPLAFRTLGVRRMPGIVDGGWELADLSPGVNVVWGPNGAGKTTAASAMQALLWPGAATGSRPLLDARIAMDGGEWRVDLDGAAARWQRDGAPSSAPAGIPSAAERDRYRLSLHELLSETDRSLAERIVHESAGGFDVARASDALGFRRGAGQARQEREALEKARAALQAARDEEGRLREDETRLGTLRAEAAEHRKAAGRQAVWERALERLEAMEKDRRAREALAAYPAEVANVAGGEAEQLRALRQALAQAEGRVRAASHDIDDARSAMQASGLPPAGVPADVVATLSASLTRLLELQQARDRIASALEGTRAACRAERTAVAGVVGDDAVETLALPAVDELLRFAREAEQHRADVRAAEAELAWLGTDGTAGDADAMARGRHVLGEWLRLAAPDGGGRAKWAGIAAAVLALLAGAGLGIAVHPAGWLVAAAAGALLFLLLSGGSAPADGRPGKQAEYERLGLERPASWEPKAVAEVVDRLERGISDARMQAAQAARREAVARRAAELRQAGTAIDGRRAELAGRVGLAPDADEAAVAWLCQRVHRWQAALADVRAREAESAEADERYRAAFAAMEGALPRVDTVGSPQELAGALEDLRARRDAHEQARGKLHAAEQRLREAADDVAGRRAEAAALLVRAGLAADGDVRLEELCALRQAYGDARDRQVGAEQDVRTAERRLAEAAGFDESVPSLSASAVEEKLAASRTSAERADEAEREATRLDERLRSARLRTDVEAALAGVQDAEAALRECRARDEAAAAGFALRELVERETRDRDRPAVFHRARALLAGITRGRYRLELSPDAEAGFRAVDTGTGMGHSLDELSRGTRVQLLIAVRIAFIETMEGGLMLPLVLDEALGNSDDVRAESVMDAVIELARSGRQVFFLTARVDEAERWKARLAADGVEHALVDLAQARGIARFAELPRTPAAALQLGAVPAPGSMDHAAYGTALRVPPVDLHGAGCDGVHLWYLVDDPALLHRLLSLGATTWGGLRTMVEQVGLGLLGPDGTGYPRLVALARATERLLEARRVGRGRPVEHDALARSGAISGTFIERVEQLRRDMGGQPDRLLAGMQELPRFRADALAAFTAFLTDEGYLDPREPLDDDRVRIDVLSSIAGDLREGRCDPADVARLLAHVPG